MWLSVASKIYCICQHRSIQKIRDVSETRLDAVVFALLAGHDRGCWSRRHAILVVANIVVHTVPITCSVAVH